MGGIAAYKVAKQNDAVAAEKAKLPDFKKIGNECIIGDEETELTAGSDGRSLSMFIPESNMYEGMKTQQCVNQQLHVPSGILSKMEQTSGLDGSQHDSWGNLEVTWSYNGNSGFRATYEVKEE
ncbi:hypothetical protein OZX57_06360 [Bifidobacterium sp. ESL0682]|uniref:hypothetical protein n=1 Tax=Bifidobacterium sp. ESL0682 TaxID=2983212 RepID=UPI0023F8982F|nr:hypothetical protein [Bifidobacterium sp. ESL0682]WEV41608.1 hypothetical protein OZX57_06360 [Bifidobacterium sp. ESL0682]